MVEFDDIDWGQRRRYVRRPVRLRVMIRARGHEFQAFSENISPGGVFVQVALAGDLDLVEALIDLPNGKEMHVKGRVCWRRPEPLPGVGINFEQFLHAPELMGSGMLG